MFLECEIQKYIDVYGVPYERLEIIFEISLPWNTYTAEKGASRV